MLTVSQFDKLSGPIIELYESYTQTVINDIARRLAKTGKVTSSAAWQMQRLMESGKTYNNALAEVAKLSGKTTPVLRKMFTDAGVESTTFDDSIYKAAGLKPIPLSLSPASLNTLLAGLRKTQGVLKNLTMSSALDAEQTFTSAADLAYLQVSSGAMSYDQAVRAGIKKMSHEGLKTVNYASGRKDQLDVAMRRSVLTGVSQTTNELSLSRAKDLDLDLVQTSAHIGARPDHQLWQGRIFSISGSSAKFPKFDTATGYGTVTGLGGINCRHSFYPFFEGISENAYSQATLGEYAGKSVTYNGKEIPIYDGLQMQRGIEREIRASKREIGALNSAGLDSSAETIRMKALQAKMRDFTAQTGLVRDYGREGGRVAKGVVKPPVKTVPIVPTGPVVPILPAEFADVRLFQPGTEESRQEISDKIARRLSKWSDLGTPEEIQVKFASKMQEIAYSDDSTVSIRVQPSNVEEILQDGRLKSTFEVMDPLHSKGYRSSRLLLESQTMGVPRDTPDAVRPIYGYLNSSKLYDPKVDDPASGYGNVEIVLNKSRTMGRSTFTLGDSFAGDETRTSTFTQPKLHAETTADGSFAQSILQDKKISDYVEMQIYGGVKLVDIDHVVIHGTNTLSSKQIDLFHEKGITVMSKLDRSTPAVVIPKPVVAPAVPKAPPLPAEFANVRVWQRGTEINRRDESDKLAREMSGKYPGLGTPEQIKEKFVTTMQEIAYGDDSTVSVRVPLERVGKIVRDGRLMNSFEFDNVASQGEGYLETRRVMERRTLGIPSGEPAVERPLYGYLNSPSLYDSESRDPADDYGRVELVLNKSRTLGRSTFTLGDSFAGINAANSTFSQPIVSADTNEWGKNVNAIIQKKKVLGYVELQIFGGVTLKDIDHVVMHDVKPSPELLELLHKMGISVEMRKK